MEERVFRWMSWGWTAVTVLMVDQRVGEMSSCRLAVQPRKMITASPAHGIARDKSEIVPYGHDNYTKIYCDTVHCSTQAFDDSYDSNFIFYF
jgi:hypothetical protein